LAWNWTSKSSGASVRLIGYEFSQLSSSVRPHQVIELIFEAWLLN